RLSPNSCSPVAPETWRRWMLVIILLLDFRFRFSLVTGHMSLSVLCLAHVFHPLDNLAVVELFLNRYVRHRGGRRRAMPMLFVRREQHRIARPNFLDRSSPAFRPAAPGGNDESLA